MARSVATPGPILFVGQLRQGDETHSDTERNPLALGIGQLFGQFTGFFGPRTPMLGVVDAMRHFRLPARS